MDPDNITVVKTIEEPIVAGNGVAIAINVTAVKPVPVPTKPPIIESIRDSIRN